MHSQKECTYSMDRWTIVKYQNPDVWRWLVNQTKISINKYNSRKFWTVKLLLNNIIKNQIICDTLSLWSLKKKLYRFRFSVDVKMYSNLTLFNCRMRIRVCRRFFFCTLLASVAKNRVRVNDCTFKYNKMTIWVMWSNYFIYYFWFRMIQLLNLKWRHVEKMYCTFYIWHNSFMCIVNYKLFFSNAN